MHVWDGSNYLGDTQDEFGFSTGMHHIKVEGDAQSCNWDIDIVAGFMPCQVCPANALTTSRVCPASALTTK